MHSSAAHSASITPAASCTSARTAGCASGSAPSRAATAVEACDVETSRTPLAGPNAPSTSPWRSVFVQHGRPAEYRWRRALREKYCRKGGASLFDGALVRGAAAPECVCHLAAKETIRVRTWVRRSRQGQSSRGAHNANKPRNPAPTMPPRQTCWLVVLAGCARTHAGREVGRQAGAQASTSAVCRLRKGLACFPPSTTQHI